ncbi:hypothetical protein AVEN_248296-1 [Araneus ventricosus]|uniref:Uncharacterized protein n=1 Tax=Araneus ventricosus TaxID=182803 RepID=A0A4Y2FIM3_ARAVE|nr:hypothetical protein AVEN_248296-1 [Araneus ventricosus]
MHENLLKTVITFLENSKPKAQSVSDELCSEWIKLFLIHKNIQLMRLAFQKHVGQDSSKVNSSMEENKVKSYNVTFKQPTVESESYEEQELHIETHQCEEWEKVSKFFNLSKTPPFEKFTEFDSEVQVCGLMMRSFLKQFLRLRVMRKRWMFQQTPTLLRVRLKMLFTSCSCNVQKTWKKRI